jgi:hypothetical protein
VAWPSTFLFGDPPDATRGPAAGPPTRAASIPGLEARHTWFATTNGFLAATPLASLNYRWDASGNRRQPLPSTLSAAPGRVAAGAVAVLDKISGLHSRADSDDNRGNNQGRPGEYLLPSVARGRTITYEGRLRAGSLNALREAEANMRTAYSGSEGLMLVEYNPLYSSSEEIVWLYFGRVTQFEVVDEQTAAPDALFPHERSFVLAIRQHDPRYYRWNAGDGAGFVGVGSLPVDGSAQTLINEGSAPTEPVYEISSPGTNVTIFNATTGKTLALVGLPSLAGSVLTVDFGLRLAYKDFFAQDLTGFVDLSATNAWDFGQGGLVPGLNAVGIATGSGSWGAKWRGAYW